MTFDPNEKCISESILKCNTNFNEYLFTKIWVRNKKKKRKEKRQILIVMILKTSIDASFFFVMLYFVFLIINIIKFHIEDNFKSYLTRKKCDFISIKIIKRYYSFH